MSHAASSPRDLAERVPDGARIALPADYAGGAMAVVRELVRREARDLRLVGVPQLGLAADILIGAGCVTEIETAAISLGEHGLAFCFDRAYRAGAISVRESTCPAIHAGLRAAEKALPFLPVRGILGSDLLRVRPDWKVIDNPFPPYDPIVVVPAIRPDVALFHGALADREGAVWVGVRRELMVMAHASAATLATAERLADGRLLDDAALAAGTIPSLYVTAVAVVPEGSRPLGLWGVYAADGAALARYKDLASTPQGFARFLEEWMAA